MTYFVYILQSDFDKSYYIGYTSDLQRRIAEHNSGQTRYTSKKKPWQLVYLEEFSDKSQAMKREKFLKKQKNQDFYQRLIDEKNTRMPACHPEDSGRVRVPSRPQNEK